MSVPKGRRSESKFEAQHHFIKLRNDITELIVNDFGYSEKKYIAKMEKFIKSHKNDPNKNEIVECWQNKITSFKSWYIDEEARAILDITRRIETEFSIGNSIYPSETPAKIIEFLVRRWHINRAIGLCFALKQEINYVIRTLPVDINKFERFSVSIDEQISLYKGVRQADNRLLRPKNNNDKGLVQTIEGEIAKVFDGIAVIISKIGKIEQRAN